MIIIMLSSASIAIGGIYSTNHKNVTGSAHSMGLKAVISKEITPDEPEIRNYFNEVSKVPYKANYKSNVPKSPQKFWKDNCGDCDDKSNAFADYLYKKGAKDLWIVTITHTSGKYSHSFVLWKNRVFDPTATPGVYNYDREKYYNQLQKDGFKMWAASTYTPDIHETRQELADKKYIS